MPKATTSRTEPSAVSVVGRDTVHGTSALNDFHGDAVLSGSNNTCDTLANLLPVPYQHPQCPTNPSHIEIWIDSVIYAGQPGLLQLAAAFVRDLLILTRLRLTILGHV